MFCAVYRNNLIRKTRTTEKIAVIILKFEKILSYLVMCLKVGMSDIIDPDQTAWSTLS